MTVPILQDNVDEMNETFTLELEVAVAIPGVTVGINMAFGNIIDSTGIYGTMESKVVVLSVFISNFSASIISTEQLQC